MTLLCYIENMDEILQQIGLSDKASSLYLLLLRKPGQTAQQLSEQTDIGRTNVYRLIDELLEQGLVVRDTSPVSKFSATEPQALQKLLQQRQQELKQTSKALSAAMPQFRSEYSLALDKPGVFYMAGMDGFERLLLDMVKSRTEVLLVASDDLPAEESVLHRFRELLMERKNAGVKTRALFHNCDYADRIKREFAERGMETRFIGTTPFKGEVAIYEDNVVFGVYDPSLINTVLTNKHIADTMRLLFEQLWVSASDIK